MSPAMESYGVEASAGSIETSTSRRAINASLRLKPLLRPRVDEARYGIVWSRGFRRVNQVAANPLTR